MTLYISCSSGIYGGDYTQMAALLGQAVGLFTQIANQLKSGTPSRGEGLTGENSGNNLMARNGDGS